MNNQCYFCLKVNFLFFVVLVTLSKDVEAQYFEDVTGASIEVILDEYPYQHVRAFDFDRDGDQDLLIFAHTSDPAVEAPSRTSMVYMCENNGGLDFSDAVYLSGTRVSAQDVFFEDVDQDGFLDLIYSGSSFNDLNNSGCYWRPEDSAFADPALWNTTFSYYYASHVADLNNDGFPDVIHNDTDLETGQLWLSNNQAQWGSAGYFSMPATSTNGYRSFDVDGDGDLDLLSPGTTFGGNPQMGFYLRVNDGSGQFSEAIELVEGSWKLDNMLFLDFDQDTWLDALSWDVLDNEVLLVSNLNEEGNSVSVDLPLAAVDVLFNADLNGSGYDELLKVDDTSMSVLEIQNGEVTSVYSKIISQNQILEFVVDVDQDGFPDVIAIDSGNKNVLVYRNTFHEYGCMNEAACNFNPSALYPLDCLFDCLEIADLTADGSVDAPDLLMFLQSFGCTGNACLGDFNNDGITAAADLLFFLNWFGATSE